MDNSYGADYQSGQIRVAMTRGNKQLECGNAKLGNKYFQAGIYFGPPNGVKNVVFTKETPEDWYLKFHDFSIVWTPGKDYLSRFRPSIHDSTSVQVGLGTTFPPLDFQRILRVSRSDSIWHSLLSTSNIREAICTLADLYRFRLEAIIKASIRRTGKLHKSKISCQWHQVEYYMLVFFEREKHGEHFS